MEKSILILEDSPTCQVIARESLKPLGKVKIATTCLEARNLLNAEKFDIVLIDMNLPDGNGFEFYGQILSDDLIPQTNVIFVTSDEDISKKVAAFSIGAGDYVTKPYSPLELRARVARFLNITSQETKFFDKTSGLSLDLSSYRASRKLGSKDFPLTLTPNEFKILHLLVRNPERIYSRDQIISLVWGSHVFISDRTIDTHISMIRKKISDLGKNIMSIRGEGYCWRMAEKKELAA